MNNEIIDRLHYAGGFLDAEGSFSIRSTRQPVVGAYNNNLEMLQYVQGIIGGSISTNYRGEHTLNTQALGAVAELCRRIAPYLILKKPQAELLLQAATVSKPLRQALREKVMILNDKDAFIPEVPSDAFLVKKDLTTSTHAQRSYFGGWLDGDSDLYFQPQKYGPTNYHYPWIHVHSVRPEPLIYIRDIFGGKLESRQREGNTARIYDLGFEDQEYVPKICELMKDYVFEKHEQMAVVLEASKFAAKDRGPFVEKMTAANARFRGRHVFKKNADGSYVEDEAAHIKPQRNGGRKKLQPHTWSSELLKEQKISDWEEF